MGVSNKFRTVSYIKPLHIANELRLLAKYQIRT